MVVNRPFLVVLGPPNDGQGVVEIRACAKWRFQYLSKGLLQGPLPSEVSFGRDCEASPPRPKYLLQEAIGQLRGLE